VCSSDLSLENSLRIAERVLERWAEYAPGLQEEILAIDRKSVV